MPDNILNANNASSEQEHTEMFLRISSRMLNANDEDSFMNETLADIGKVLGVSRAYVFERMGDLWSNTFEWVAGEITPFKDDLQEQNMHDLSIDAKDMLHVLASGKPYIVNNIEEIENKKMYDFLALQDIVGILTIPLFADGEIVGMFGLDQCHESIGWTEENVNTAIILGSLLNNAKAYFQAQRKLQRKKDQVQQLFDAFPFPIYVADMQNYAVLFCNKIIRELFDASRISEEPCYKIFQNLDTPCPFCTNALLKKDAPPYIWHHHNPLVGRDYKVIDRCMTWENVDNARLSIALDITDSLHLQREQVLEREANVAKGRFVANMSHELRTPLNGIIGMTHLAYKANSDASIEHYLEKIQLSSKNLLGIINDILDFSKIENEEMQIESLPFSFNEIIFEVQAILQTAADRKGITLQCSIDDNIPPWLQGDSLRLSQIILNLANNAIKFTKVGGVNINVHSHGNEDKLQHVTIVVKDTGIGISEKNIKKLFAEFAQAETSISRDFGGTGLGLAIVGRLVEIMGGTIEVDSVVGKGSSFTCKLSFMQSSEQVRAQSNAQEEKDDINIAGVRILLVEDNEINTIVATEVLEQYGCIVENAEDGAIALAKLKQSEYDLVIMDIQMPNMDGLEAAEYIRRDQKYDNMPIVAMSAHAMVQDREKSLNAGMQEHITKPFVPEELRKVIYRHASNPFTFQRK